MSNPSRTEESHSLRGPIDRPALIAIRDIIVELEPLATPELDDFLNPSVLEVRLDEGLRDADRGRIDVQWTTRGDYLSVRGFEKSGGETSILGSASQ